VDRSPPICPAHDVGDNRGLGVGVLLNVPPAPGGEFPLGPGVEIPVGGVGTQSVAEQQHPVGLGAPGGERVQVDVDVRSFEETVLEPLGFPDAQFAPGGHHVRQVRRFVRGIRHLQHDVDDPQALVVCRHIVGIGSQPGCVLSSGGRSGYQQEQVNRSRSRDRG
jgi:hypothetical protein